MVSIASTQIPCPIETVRFFVVKVSKSLSFDSNCYDSYRESECFKKEYIFWDRGSHSILLRLRNSVEYRALSNVGVPNLSVNF